MDDARNQVTRRLLFSSSLHPPINFFILNFSTFITSYTIIHLLYSLILCALSKNTKYKKATTWKNQECGVNVHPALKRFRTCSR